MIRTMLALLAITMLGLVLSGCDSEPTPAEAPPGVQPPPPIEVSNNPGMTKGE